MVDRFEKIDAILHEHAEVSGALEREWASVKSGDLLAENKALREQLEESVAQGKRRAEEGDRLLSENRRLKNELYSQIFNEKARALNLSDARLSALFDAGLGTEQNRLKQFETNAKGRIDAVLRRLEKQNTEETDSVRGALADLEKRAAAAAAAADRRAAALRQAFFADKAEHLRQLREEPLTEEQIAQLGKRNNIETLFGLKILNKLGVLLILLGVIAAARFAYPQIPDVAKGALVYLLGAVMLVAGEFLGRRKADIFTVGLSSGGVAVLYAATALSFFVLDILTMYPALLLCVLITAAAFVLSRRHNSQTIAAFALVGGYLPAFSLESGFIVYCAMVYFFILNAFALSVSVRKQWIITQYIGFALNLVSASYILILILFSRYDAAEAYGFLAYVFIAFSVYQMIPILSVYTSKARFRKANIVLLILNTAFGAALLFGALWTFDLWDFAGVLAVALSAVCILAASLVQAKMKSETAVSAQFYIAGLTFAVLIVPLQLDKAYFSLGWLIEGVLLLCYGIWKERGAFARAGAIIYGICFASFILIDIPSDGRMFFFKYLFITLSALLVLAEIIYKKIDMRSLWFGPRIFKCCAVVNLWLFGLYAIYDRFYPLLRQLQLPRDARIYISESAAVVFSLLFAYLIARAPVVSDKPVRIISLCIGVLSFLSLFCVNGDAGFVATAMPMVAVCAVLLLCLTNLLAVFVMRDLLLRLVQARALGAEWYPLALSAFFVLLTVQNLVTTLALSYSSLIITFLFAVTALAWILFGFIKRYQYNRLFGLALSFIAVVKLFIVDLTFWDDGLRILSYFLMGLALLAISFVYQYFNKKLDGKGEENT